MKASKQLFSNPPGNSEKISEELRRGVCNAYSAAAETPDGRHPFPVGRSFAESIGYPGEWLNALPPGAPDTFTGVSNVSVTAELFPGATVLDLGCGAGLDCFVAADRVGKTGFVYGIDFSRKMLGAAEKARQKAGISNVTFLCGSAESLPFGDGFFDIVLVNGIFNLNPYRKTIFEELFRVIRPGGELFAAELILKAPQQPKAIGSLNDWFS